MTVGAASDASAVAAAAAAAASCAAAAAAAAAHRPAQRPRCPRRQRPRFLRQRCRRGRRRLPAAGFGRHSMEETKYEIFI